MIVYTINAPLREKLNTSIQVGYTNMKISYKQKPAIYIQYAPPTCSYAPPTFSYLATRTQAGLYLSSIVSSFLIVLPVSIISWWKGRGNQVM